MRWSIAQRLVRWVTATSICMAVLFVASAFWFVRRELRSELELLGLEEIEELEANLRGREFSRSELESILRKISDDHPGYRLTWRLWQPETDRPWATFGSTPRVALPESTAGAGEMPNRPASGVRWRFVDVAMSVPDEPGLGALRVGLLLDSLPRRQTAIRGFVLFAGIVGFTALLSSLGGWLLSRRVARTLAEAAERARLIDARGLGSPITANEAPREVLALADAFRASLDALQQQYARNLLLTAGMAHELRSPLQNLMGEVSVALLRDREPVEYRRVLESQLEELRDLSRVVDNLITLTALRQSGRLARTERFQLGDEVELRLAKESAAAAKAGQVLEIEREGDLEVEGDREALVLAVRNLVDNALRHARERGRVEVLLHGDGPAVEVTVDDDGEGVPPAAREGIFEEFRRAPAQAQRRGGYGLGLALARAAAEAHGGTVDLGDSPLGGARFRLTLPRASHGTPTDGVPSA
jgi:signal transduction histidine kinase